MAFAQLEPFGHRALWGGFAMLAALTYNLNRPKGKKAAKMEDFMPKEPTDEMGWQDMMQHARTVTEMFGGQTRKGA